MNITERPHQSVGAPPVDLSDPTRPLIARLYRTISLLLLGLGVTSALANAVMSTDPAARRVAVTVNVCLALLALLDLQLLRRQQYRWSTLVQVGTIMAGSVVVVWSIHRETYVYVLCAMVVLFVRLPLRMAIGGAVGLWGFALAAYHWRWHAEAMAVVRVAQSGAFLIVLLTVLRRAFDESVARLRQTSGLLSDTLQSLEQGVAVLDPEGWVQLYNERAVEILGVPRDMTDGRAVNASDIARLQQARGELEEIDTSAPEVLSAFKEGGSVFDPRLPDRYVRRGRDGRWIEVHTQHRESGSIIRTYSDVTSYVDARRDAERAAAERTRFLASVSHELRTPMNAIIGLAHLALDSEPTGARREALLGVEDAASQISDVVDDMLDLAMLESGDAAFVAEPFALRELLERVTARKAQRFAANDIEVVVSIASGTDRWFVGDVQRLERMLSALVRRIAMATERGRVGISADAELVGADRMMLRLEVTGTGRGRSVGHEATGQGPLQDETVGEGRGGESMGVANVRRYAELMGGTLGIVGASGDSTIGWFSVPVSLMTPATAASGSVPHPRAPQLHLARPAASTTASAQAAVVDRIPAVVAPALAASPVPQAASSVHDSGPAPTVSRMQGLLDTLMGRLTDLGVLPYRTWRLTMRVAAALSLSIALVTALHDTRQPRAVFPGDVLVPLAFGLFALAMAVRHRRLTGNFTRDSRIQLVLTVLLYWLAVRENALSPATVVPAALIPIYIVHPLWVARLSAAVLILSTPVALIGMPVDQELLVRALAASSVSVVLMEWVLRHLSRVVGTLEEAGGTIGELSRELVRDNERLQETAARADRAVASRTTLMAAVSHEIRTPMNAILGLTRLVSDGPLTTTQREWMSRIRDNGQHLLQLINEVLDLARFEAGKTTIEMQPVHLAAVIDQVADVLAREGKAKGLRTQVDVWPDVPNCVISDRMRLVQLLLNLVNNAIKYTEQGEVRLRVSCLARDGAASTLCFEVADTGIGLTTAQQSRLFQPFEQLESTGSAYGGAGLGLSICKWIADRMGGRFEVDSVRGQGSTFRFIVTLERGTLPDTAVAGRPRAPARLDRLVGARVLVADDHRVNRLVASELLRRQGVEIFEASDGEAALAAVARWRPDLVLMDVQMPVLDGVAATRRLRADPAWQGVPVIAMTAATFAADEARCREAGMNDFLTKPVEPETLLALVARWLPDRAPHARGEVHDAAVAPVPSTAFLAPFAERAGVDVAAGLRRVENDRALYVTILRSFVNDHGGSCDRLSAALMRGALAEARQVVHSLSGLAGTVGADAVHRSARALEQLIVAGAEASKLDSALHDLRLAADPVFASLREALSDESPGSDAWLSAPADSATGGSPEAADMASHAERRRELYTLLRASDPEALSYLQRNMDILSTLAEPDRNALVAATESLDLYGAAEILRESGLLVWPRAE